MPPISPTSSGRIDPTRVSTAEQPESSNRQRPALERNPALPSRSNSAPIRGSGPMLSRTPSGNASPDHEGSPLLRGMSSNSQRFDLHGAADSSRAGTHGSSAPSGSGSGGGDSGGVTGLGGDPPAALDRPFPTLTPEWLASAVSAREALRGGPFPRQAPPLLTEGTANPTQGQASVLPPPVREATPSVSSHASSVELPQDTGPASTPPGIGTGNTEGSGDGTRAQPFRMHVGEDSFSSSPSSASGDGGRGRATETGGSRKRKHPDASSDLGKRKRDDGDVAAGTAKYQAAEPPTQHLGKRKSDDSEPATATDKRARTGPGPEPMQITQPFHMRVDSDFGSSGSSSGSATGMGGNNAHAGGPTFENRNWDFVHRDTGAGTSGGAGGSGGTHSPNANGRTFDHAGGATFAQWNIPRTGETTDSNSSSNAQHGPPGGNDTGGTNAARPERSWRSVAGALTGTLGSAGRVAVREAALTLGVSKLAKIEPRLLGALAGHAIHQTVAVGIPTVVREMVAQGVKTALAAAPAGVTIGLQVGVGIANAGIQVYREARERRDPAAAAQGFHALTAAEWAAKTPAEQDALIKHQQRVSRLVTALQIGSSLTNLALTLNAVGRGDKAAAAAPVANEIKAGVYAGMRDFLQASFRMVDVPAIPGRQMAPGLKGGAHGAAAGMYLAANAGTSMMGDALKGQLLPHLSQAQAVLTRTVDTHKPHMSVHDALGTFAKSTAISAGMNVIAETADWFNRTQQHANMTGHKQEWSPALKGEDYARLLDQAPSRAALINTINSGIAGVSHFTGHQTSLMQEFIGNATLGAISGMLDSPIEGLWGAQDGVRTAVRQEAAARNTATADIEMGRVPPNSPNLSGGSSPTSHGTQAGFGMSGHIETPRVSRANTTLDERGNPNA